MQRRESLRENGLVKGLHKGGFSINKLKELSHAEDSKRSHRMIKSGKTSVDAYRQAGKGLNHFGGYLSDWGSRTRSVSINDISDKLGVLVSELGESELEFVKQFDESRLKLKGIRDMEDSIAPSRAHRQRLVASIEKEEEKDPLSPRLIDLQNQLVRTEAENLVGEMQLDNKIREVMKSSFQQLMDAFQVRAQKQMTVGYYSRLLVDMINDDVVYPGDNPVAYNKKNAAQIMHQCMDSMSRLMAPLSIDERKSDDTPMKGSSSSLQLSERDCSPSVENEQNVLQVRNVPSQNSTSNAETYKAQLLSTIAEEQKQKELQAKSTVLL
ncbi:sporulation protein Meu14 [Schizosaccharomyces octosporus yFS286]|uniref:Sporulation protein Meu14 n=1 Tax=Schizosaccharomyces octosporus (strain yFS286) TaxID=483514 RepID=S9PPW2_SCHOY|nr:sporulation protein Meu14 [Schizosaccharomyces octosporus yFS286]EPX71266.1 sporulation protein Meu14 [Schizosaccharomyces octosporus yFS286]